MFIFKFDPIFVAKMIKKRDEPALLFDSAVLKIGTLPGLPGNAGDYSFADFLMFFKNINTIQASFLTFIIKNGQFSLFFTSF